jgi:hypothetical protein
LKDFLGDDLADAYLENVIAEAHDHATTTAITYDEFLGLWDMNADEQIKTAKIVVGSRRVKHAASTLSTVSSGISDDENDTDVFLDDPIQRSHREEEKSSKKTGCCVFEDHRVISVRKVVPTPISGDV